MRNVPNGLLSWLPVIILMLVLTACDDTRAIPARTLSTDSLRVEVMVPGGVFRTGDNPVVVRLWSGSAPVTVDGGDLAVSMPWMGHRHHMHMRSRLVTRGAGSLAGRVHLAMGGVWSAQLHLDTHQGPVCDTFRIEVLD